MPHEQGDGKVWMRGPTGFSVRLEIRLSFFFGNKKKNLPFSGEQ
jgi:hypothetical protein